MSVPWIICRTEYSSAEAPFQLQIRCGISGGAMFAAVPEGCYLLACLQVATLFLQAGGSHAITMLGQKQVICSGLVNFCHELILCHDCSEVTRRKRGQGACIKCASKSGSFFHDKANEGEAQKGVPAGKVGREALHTSVLFQVVVVGYHSFESLSCRGAATQQL